MLGFAGRAGVGKGALAEYALERMERRRRDRTWLVRDQRNLNGHGPPRRRDYQASMLPTRVFHHPVPKVIDPGGRPKSVYKPATSSATISAAGCGCLASATL